MEIVCPNCNSQDVFFSKKRRKFVCEDCETEFLPEQKVIPQRIFFSYGHDKNEPVVLAIKNALEKRGHTIWIDKEEIRPGGEWRKQITDGLIDTSAVLSFLSSHSVRSPGVCLDELRIALCVKHGYVRTILLEQEELVCVPTTVSDVQWLDLSDWESYFHQGEPVWSNWFQLRMDEVFRIVESDDAREFAGEIQQLKGVLTPNLLDSKEQALLKESYVGREWLSEIVDDWISTKNANRAFVLVANPGLGKSCFSAHLLHYNPNVVCGLFCEWDKPQTNNVKGVIKTIAFKLACKLPDYRKLLLDSLTSLPEHNGIEKRTPEELFDYLLVNPLASLIDGNRATKIIIIDGLDETVGVEGNLLMRLLADNLRRLPQWIRFILTSRPEHNVETIFEEYNPHVLNPDSAQNRDDIRNYVAFNLHDELSNSNDRLGILDHIITNAQGSFLYASLVVKNIKVGLLQPEDIIKYPPGLNAFYYKSFKRKYPDHIRYRDVRSILEMVVAARQFPIGLFEMLDIDKYSYRELLSGVGSLLIESNVHLNQQVTVTSVMFCHKSIADWLTNDEKAGEFYIDAKAGASFLATKARDILSRYGIKKLAAEAVSPTNCEYKFLERNISDFFAQAERWGELEVFLLDPGVPFVPYWKAIASFPQDWNMDLIAKRLKEDETAIDFFLYLQQVGDINFILRLFGIMIKQFDISELSIELFKIYTDIVHLSGQYANAVQLAKAYLLPHSLEAIIADKDLMQIQSRMLHHCKFFIPAGEIIDQINVLIDKIDPNSDPGAYLELLIMGGNMGTLMGDLEYAQRCNDEALNFSQLHQLRNYELRAVRKKIDLLKHERLFDEAFSILHRYVNPAEEPETRYHVYLICSLGELYRYTGDFNAAYKCYSLVKQVTKERGISGWWAHSVLATGCLMFDHGHLCEAQELFKSALDKYIEIGQDWGMITARIYLLMLERQQSKPLCREMLEQVKCDVARLQYDFYLPYVSQIEQGFPIRFLPLMFI